MQYNARHRSTEQGLTLLEALVALVLVSVVIGAIAPPIILALATRVQNQRNEQALSVAQAEINRVRLLVDRGGLTSAQLDQLLPPKTTNNDTAPAAVPVPTSTTPATPANCNGDRSKLTVTDWCGVDTNADNKFDLAIQTFRTQVKTTTIQGIPVFFQMGVRVYTKQSIDAYAGNGLKADTSRLKLTSGQSAVQSPLVVLYAPITRSDYTNSSDSALRQYCLSLAPGSSTCPPN
ncbi:prepilin-type N-terminal cleavage/methylation domain-containing protein [Leptolyngbya sp. FACHB-261]|nr:prepilin-type N-terminal cleavage/methylation domain-containing protein [Leptolyngbya sp. FACHB-261]